MTSSRILNRALLLSVLTVSLLFLTTSVSAQGSDTANSCSVSLKDKSKATDVVVEGCSSVGVFSIGGNYEGVWEKLTYYYPQPWRGTFLTIKTDGKVYSTSMDPADTILMDPYITEYPHIGEDGSLATKWTLPEKLLVEESFRLVENGTLITVKLTNTNPYDLMVGARLHIDTMLGTNDGAPIYLPGIGLRTRETVAAGCDLSLEYWKAYNSPDQPTIVATGILDPKQGMTYPDKIIVADWKKSKDTGWDYQVDSSKSILGDSAVLLYYDQKILPAFSTREIVSGYGNSEPVLKKDFGVTEITLDRVKGDYCPGDSVKIRVDVLSSRSERQGTVKIEVRSRRSGDLIYEDEKPTGAVSPNVVVTPQFEFTVPNISESDSFDVKATLLDKDDTVLDERYRDAVINIDSLRCRMIPEVKVNWSLLALILLALAALAVMLAYLRKRFMGRVKVVKVREGDRVIVKVINNTREDLHDCVVEDAIPKNAEVDVKTIDVRWAGNKLVWDLGTLKAGGEATLEYMIRGVYVIPPAKFSWDTGEEISN